MKINYALLALMLLFCKTCLSASLRENYEQVLKIINGKPVEEIGTPFFCGDPKPPENEDEKIRVWFSEGEGSCKKLYVPNIYGLFTPLSQMGEISQFFFDDKTYYSLLALLRTMSESSELEQLKPLPKLDMQMTFWEMVVTLEGRKELKLEWDPPIDQKRMDALLKLSHLMLSKLLFSKNDLVQIRKMAAIETNLIRYKKQLSQGCFLEADKPNRVHEQMSQNRIYGRVFIGTDQKKSCSTFQRIAEEGVQLNLNNLPKHIAGVHTILIFFYNVLDKNYNLVDTGIIHGVRENSYLDKTHFRLPLLKQLALFKTFTIERQKSLDVKSQESAYKVIPEDQMVRRLIIDVNPVRESKENALITFNKANCFSCHSSNIKALDYISIPRIKKVTFSKPFARKRDYYINRPAYEKYKSKFASLYKKYMH